MHLPLLILTLAALASAENRIFGAIGTPECQACLAKVEAACNGPITSAAFNKCFCAAADAAAAPAWKALAACLRSDASDCAPDQQQILGYYGSHCFAYNAGEDDEICVEANQGDDLKLSLADSFCTAFVTPTKNSTHSSTASATDAETSTDSAARTQTITATETEEASATTAESTSAKTSTSAPATQSSAPAETSPETQVTVKPSTTAPEAASTTGTGASPSKTNAGPLLQPVAVSVYALLVVFVAAVLL